MIKDRLLRFLHLILIIIVTFYFIQCTKEVSIPLPNFEGKSVINSFLRKDSILTLILSKSVPINDEGIKRINNAEIRLFQNGSLIDSFSNSGNGIYRTHKRITQSSTYSLVAHFDNETLASSDYLPNSPLLLSVKRNDKGGLNEDGYYGTLEIELLDESIQLDYYEIELTYISIVEQIIFPLYPRTETEKIILNENLPSYGKGKPFPFSDELFNGDTVKIIFDYFTPKQIYNGVIQEIDPNYLLTVKIRKTSKNYYLFRKSVINHFESQEPDFWNGIGEPLNVHTNIEGGKGIFAAYSEIIDTLKRKEQ